jgi:hypothetical protein
MRACPRDAVEWCGSGVPLREATRTWSDQSEDLVGRDGAVDVGGVEEVDAGIKGGVHDRLACWLVDVPTEVHGAQRDPADLGSVRPRLADCIPDLLWVVRCGHNRKVLMSIVFGG